MKPEFDVKEWYLRWIVALDALAHKQRLDAIERLRRLEDDGDRDHYE